MKLFPRSRKDQERGPRRRREWGQGLAEFALALPVILLIILLLIEAAFLIQGYLAVEHAAREAVRWAISYRPVQGQQLDETLCTDTSAGDGIADFLFSDPDDEQGINYPCDPNENTAEYNARRVAMMKQTAFHRAAGVRVREDALGLTETEFEANFNKPGFFGVRVWGFPSFEEPEQVDHASLPGLPVRVQVVHNVEIVDPLFRMIATHVRVEAHAEMINEGIQVGFGNVPPPTFLPPPTFEVDPGGGSGTTTPSPSPSPPAPTTYLVYVTVSPDPNELPDERRHDVTVTVTDDMGTLLPYVRVSLSTSFGAYSYSGTEPQYVEALTDENGEVRQPLYANRPGTATVTAWIDLDGDDNRDAGEPYDADTVSWVAPPGPYILASDYAVFALEWITVDIYDHDPADEPYTLLWCRTSITGGIASAVLLTNIDVDDGTMDALDQAVEIPADSQGFYRLETHNVGAPSCGDAGTLVAYSSDLYATLALPDLAVDSFNVPGGIEPTTSFTMSVVIENLTPGSTVEYFDVDFFVDPGGEPPPGRVGVVKQWVSGIGPYGTATVNAVMWVESPGTHDIWVRVDTTDFVEEEMEGNNTGMVTITASCALGEQDGQVVIPATMPDSNQSGYWNWGSETKIWQGSSSGGVPTMRGLPDTGRSYSHWYDFDNPGSDGRDPPVLVYNVAFQTTGTYYIWMRGVGDGSGNSVWVTLDGRPTDDYGAANAWGAGGLAWESAMQHYGGQPTLVVSTPGVHTVEVRMREDGFQWATIVLTTTAGSGGQPSGDGPPVICGAGEPPPWGYQGKPPGLLECEQLLEKGDFEGMSQSVFAPAGPWIINDGTRSAGYNSTFSVRLLDSLGSYPTCPTLSPWLYQTVQIPADVYTLTTITVDGYRWVEAITDPGSCGAGAEADDVLWVQLQDSAGQPISGSVSIVDGGAVAGDWEAFSADLTDQIDMVSYAGQDVRIYLYGTHDADIVGTWFEMDELECNVCTEWPIPEEITGTASIGGLVRALVGAVPRPMHGMDVWAYSQGGQLYHTQSIHDGTYHFYNIPPGTYVVYSEGWVGGNYVMDSVSVSVVPDERNYSVHLLLR